MPFSYSSQLSAIVGFAEQIKPMTVLDVGTGMGQYGFLLRNNLESVNLFEIDGDKGWQRDRNRWQIVIDGIEGFEGYLTPVHHYSYSKMYIGNALAILPTMPDQAYDLVLGIDIIEHFTESDALVFANECQRVCRGSCLISTPKDYVPQDVPANVLENHRSHWTEGSLRELGFTRFLPDELSWIGVFER